jgi:hypothetical protein
MMDNNKFLNIRYNKQKNLYNSLFSNMLGVLF